jgi:hypothetical protein
MPKSPFVAIPPAEHMPIVAALRARSRDLLALHFLWWCAAGHPSTEMAVVLFCSRSSMVPHGASLSGEEPGPGVCCPRPTGSAGAETRAGSGGRRRGPSKPAWLLDIYAVRPLR